MARMHYLMAIHSREVPGHSCKEDKPHDLHWLTGVSRRGILRVVTQRLQQQVLQLLASAQAACSPGRSSSAQAPPHPQDP